MFCTKCNASNVGVVTCLCPPTVSRLDSTATFENADFAWDDLSNGPYRPPRSRIEVGDAEDSLEKRRERLGKFMAVQGGGGMFQMNLATVAAAKGQQRVGKSEDTFGDSSGED